MKHGVPLTPFSGTTIFIVLHTFKESEVGHLILNHDDERIKVKENSELNIEQICTTFQQFIDYLEDTWKDNVKFLSACFLR